MTGPPYPLACHRGEWKLVVPIPEGAVLVALAQALDGYFLLGRSRPYSWQTTPDLDEAWIAVVQAYQALQAVWAAAMPALPAEFVPATLKAMALEQREGTAAWPTFEQVAEMETEQPAKEGTSK